MILSDEIQDGIRELINIGVGRAAGLVHELTGAHVVLRIPDLRVIRYGDLSSILPSQDGNVSVVHMEYEGDMHGICALIIPYESSIRLVQLLTGEDTGPADMDIMRAETLREIGNIIINAIMGSITNVISRSLNYLLPVYTENSLAHLMLIENASPDDPIILANTRFEVTSLSIEGEVLIMMDTRSLMLLVERISSMTGGGND